MYQYTQTKKNPHLDHTVACKLSAVHKETTKERSAQRVMARALEGFWIGEAQTTNHTGEDQKKGLHNPI